jgi:hypothetical protein
MAAQDGLTFEGVFNNSSTGLYKDNTTQDISEADLRALVTAIRESYLNRIDDIVYDHWRGEWDPTGNVLPDTGDNGNYDNGEPAGGDEWVLTDVLVLDTFVYPPGTVIKAKINNPGQTRTNWIYLQTL